MSKQKRVLFCYDGFSYTAKSQQEELEIILSCEYYWVRKFSIPTKSIKEAKKALPALFEDILPQGTYDYTCFKFDEGTYICFAYENDKILQQLKNANLNISNIKSIRFAQTEFTTFKEYTFENNGNFYAYQNDILVKLPFNFTQNESKSIDNILQNIKLSTNKIDFKFYTTLLDKRFIITVSIICAIISVLNIVKYVNLSSHINKFEIQKETLQEQYNLPSTTLQMNSILSTYQNTQVQQDKFKKLISDIFRVKTVSSQAVLVQVEYVNNKVKVIFENVNEQAIKKFLAKEYKVISSVLNSDQLTMEITYE